MAWNVGANMNKNYFQKNELIRRIYDELEKQFF